MSNFFLILAKSRYFLGEKSVSLKKVFTLKRDRGLPGTFRKRHIKWYNSKPRPSHSCKMIRSTTGNYVHSHRGTNIVGEARFWFCPNLIKFAQIYSILLIFRLNFAKICPDFESIFPKKILLGDAAASPGPTSLILQYLRFYSNLLSTKHNLQKKFFS